MPRNTPLSSMLDIGDLAVHRQGARDDGAAENLADGLQPEADAEDRDRRGRRASTRSRQMPASFGRAGTGREHDRIRSGGQNLVGRDRIVAHHVDGRGQRAEQMHQSSR